VTTGRTDRAAAESAPPGRLRAWRDRVRRTPGGRQALRVAVFLLGLFFVLLGLALAALPGPLTIPPILLGVWIWSSEFAWADRLLERAGPVLARLRDATGESAQLYRRSGDRRVCVAAAERRSGLRDTVPVGSVLPLTAGSAAQVLLAWDDDDAALPGGAAYTARALAEVRRRGWAASVGEREAGVASVSAPVRGPDGAVVAAVSVSGPIERLTRSPGRLHADAVVAAGVELGRPG